MLARMLAIPHRLTLSVVLAASLLAAPSSWAQGLGELTLDSSLNEPLRASIELLDVGGLELGQLAVTIATAEEYEQAGLDRHDIVSQIEFDVELLPLGSGRVTLSTQDRVTEPYLALLVSARWPSGRVLRDYSVLLDLSDGASADEAGGQGAAPVAAPATAGSSPAEAAANQAAGADSYTVQRGDSLWEIAAQTRPAGDVSVQQMMIALQRANEDAFVNNNVNRLISGRVLRIPTRDEIGVVEHSAAVAQLNAQSRQLGAAPLGGTGTGAAGAGRDELSVLSGDDASGAGGGDLDATIAALEVELMLSEEELDRARIENEELTARLGELEEEIAMLQNIIAIEDTRIAQLQADLATQADVTEQALAEAERAATTLAAAQAPAPQGAMAQLLAVLQNNLASIGAALLVVLGLLGFLMVKARKAREDHELEFSPEADEVAVGTGPSVAAGPAAGVGQENGDVDADETAEAPGLLARLLARFRRKPAAEAADASAEAEPTRSRDDLAGPAGAADVDELSDDLAPGPYADDDERQVQQSPLMAPFDVDDDEEAEEAAALASSVLDEVDSTLQQDDVAGNDGAAEAELEFDLSETEQARSNPPETFEFNVERVADAEPEVAADGDLETFDFNLDKAAATETSAATADEAQSIETFDFKPSSAGGGFDLGSLSFDENDARREDDEDSGYTPRTAMDECDTKLDLAVAYEAMGDVDGAIEILDEVIAEGKPAQIEEAERLKAKWQDA